MNNDTNNNSVNFTINGQEITAPAGQKVLWAALDNGIYVPSLCLIKEREEPDASCRLCWVAVKGQSAPAPACVLEAADGLEVDTRGEKALALARAAFSLLMASHRVDCASCKANGRCELQKIAGYLQVSLKPQSLRLLLKNLPVDDHHPLFTYDADKCVLCGHCVNECRKRGEKAVLGYKGRGFDRVVTTFGDDSVLAACQDCLDCVRVCPTGALVRKIY